MDLGIIIYSNDPESVWNAFRFGNFSLARGDDVEIFLLGKGVEVENLDSEDFDIEKEMAEFNENKGEIHSCGTCLEIRDREEMEHCPISTMRDMYEIVEGNDKVITF